jgi:hypothetical protein
MELAQLDHVELLVDAVVSRTVYLNVLFPSKYRYYFELVNSPETPILIDHLFRLYFPQTITVEWAYPDGVYLILGADPEFHPWGPLAVQIYIPQAIYDAIIAAMQHPINSPADLVPPPEGNACGEVEFVLLSTDAGEQIKIDLVNTSYVPEIPIKVETLQWQEVLYDIMSLPLLPPSILPPSLLPPPPPIVFSSNIAYWNSGVFNTVSWDSSTLLPSSLLPPPPPIVSSLNMAYWNFGVFNTVSWDSSTLLPPSLLSPPPPIVSSLNMAHWNFGVFNTVSWDGSTQSSEVILPPVAGDSLSFEFAYTVSGVLGITFIDPRYCFLREWIAFPSDWTQAIKDFAGV